jgi:putative transposase
MVYHVLSRAHARQPIFETDEDYEAFERILEEAVERYEMRLLAYHVMPNHWHQVLWPKQDDEHFLTVCRYVERNALRAGMVPRAESWRWGSLWRYVHGNSKQRATISPWPLRRSADWVEHVNAPQTEAGAGTGLLRSP